MISMSSISQWMESEWEGLERLGNMLDHFSYQKSLKLVGNPTCCGYNFGIALSFVFVMDLYRLTIVTIIL